LSTFNTDPALSCAALHCPADFNDTDFSVSDDLLKSYLDSYEATPWDAIKYLIAGGLVGGGVGERSGVLSDAW
jgi:hypothetical protein